LLTNFLGDRIVRFLASSFFWSLDRFIAAGLGLFDWLIPQQSGNQLALIASIPSIIRLALFPGGFSALCQNVIGAFAGDFTVNALFSGLKSPPEFFGG